MIQINQNRSGDVLCELRFFVPNNDQSVLDEHKRGLDEKNAERKKDSAMKNEEEEGESEMEEGVPTPAEVFNDKLLKAAGLGTA